MASTAKRRLTWSELLDWPEDNLRRELIGGELFVTPAPVLRHQRVVRELVVAWPPGPATMAVKRCPAPSTSI